jgi:hypothetical protein
MLDDMTANQNPADPVVLRRINLRYMLTMNLTIHGTMTVKELATLLAEQGFTTAGRPSKCISDALRTEGRLGRVWRRGRGRYGPGEIPRSTEYRIHKRCLELRAQVRAAQAQARAQASAA